jgi:hypothetical protein
MERNEAQVTSARSTAHDDRSMRVLELLISFAAIATVVILSSLR